MFLPVATPEQIEKITGPLEDIFFESTDPSTLQAVSRQMDWKLETYALSGDGPGNRRT